MGATAGRRRRSPPEHLTRPAPAPDGAAGIGATAGAHPVLVVAGTAAEAIKLAPVVGALGADPRYLPLVAVTGERRDQLQPVLDAFHLTADYDLEVERDGQQLSDVTARVLSGLEPVLATCRPHLVVVQGDSTTTFAAALAAFYQQIPVAHVEAGLRSGRRYAPYPGEVNRRLITQLASLHLAPTPGSAANLRADGVPPDTIICTGNTVIDALQWTVPRSVGQTVPGLDGLGLDARRVLLATFHRAESASRALPGMGRALARLAAANPELLTVIPLHPHPAVRDAVLPAVAGRANVAVVDPIPYPAFVQLLNRADLVVTDSSGVQEEAPSLGKPVLVLRDETERPEAVAAGTVELVGTDEDRIVERVQYLLDDAGAYARMAQAVNPYGDGRAARRTLEAIRWLFGEGGRPEEWTP